jgi:hypothetical protein
LRRRLPGGVAAAPRGLSPSSAITSKLMSTQNRRRVKPASIYYRRNISSRAAPPLFLRREPSGKSALRVGQNLALVGLPKPTGAFWPRASALISEADTLCTRSWTSHSRFYATMRSDEARRDSLGAEAIGLHEFGGDPLTFARLRPAQMTAQKRTSSGKL